MISYFGSKFMGADAYPAPEFPMIVERFAGSAGYAMRYYNRQVVLCDTDDNVVAAWRYLLRATPAELLALPDVPEGGTVDDLAIHFEARVLIGYWLNRSGASVKRPSPWMLAGAHPGSFWGSRIRTRLARQVPLIRHWKILHCDYREAPMGPATHFVDPPYLGTGDIDAAPGRHYRHGTRGIDFAALADHCRALRGQVIVCEAQGATWLPFRPLYEGRTIKRGVVSSREAVCLLRDGAVEAPAQLGFEGIVL